MRGKGLVPTWWAAGVGRGGLGACGLNLGFGAQCTEEKWGLGSESLMSQELGVRVRQQPAWAPKPPAHLGGQHPVQLALAAPTWEAVTSYPTQLEAAWNPRQAPPLVPCLPILTVTVTGRAASMCAPWSLL